MAWVKQIKSYATISCFLSFPWEREGILSVLLLLKVCPFLILYNKPQCTCFDAPQLPVVHCKIFHFKKLHINTCIFPFFPTNFKLFQSQKGTKFSSIISVHDSRQRTHSKIHKILAPSAPERHKILRQLYLLGTKTLDVAKSM